MKDLNSVIKSYELSPNFRTLTDSTQSCYRSMNKALTRAFGTSNIFNLDNREEIKEESHRIYFGLDMIGLSNQRRNQIKRHLGVLHTWGVTHLGISEDSSPLRYMPTLRHEPKESNPFTKIEVQKIKDLIKRNEGMKNPILTQPQECIAWLAVFLFETAMRPDEAINITQDDIIADDDNELLQILGAKGREAGKVSRYVNITKAVNKCIQWAITYKASLDMRNSSSIFTTSRGYTYEHKNSRVVFAELMSIMHMEEKRLYDLRRGAATVIIHDQRYGITVAQKQLGHKNIATTMRYERLGKKDAAKLFKGY